MAVYTQLGKQDIISLLSDYNLGELQHYEGITAGVENTNYFLDLRTQSSLKRYVLTLFEYQDESTLSFFLRFVQELHAQNLPVPAPIANNNGLVLQRIADKPAVIVPCLQGQHLTTVTAQDCNKVGTQLALIHQTGRLSSLRQNNHRGISWLDQQQQRLASLLPQQDAHYMQAQWQNISAGLKTYQSLPKGLIHGDLFIDNVLFANQQLTGIIDFYQASHDLLLYDVAVTVNDWCINKNLMLDQAKTKQLLAHYAAIRPFTSEEQDAWQLILRLAAFRFWVSRIITFIHPEPKADASIASVQPVYTPKDPDEFKRMLEHHTKGVAIELPLP